MRRRDRAGFTSQAIQECGTMTDARNRARFRSGFVLFAAAVAIALGRSAESAGAGAGTGAPFVPGPADAPVPAREATEQMTLPKGFRATLCAAEPDVVQPIAMTIDPRGRLWVVENHSYPIW